MPSRDFPSRVTGTEKVPAYTLAAGRLAVALLSAVTRLPVPVTMALLAPALRLYPLFRPRQAARLRACFAASPFPALSLGSYYSARLGLLLQGLKSHGEALPPSVTDDASSIAVVGEERYLDALASGRPIALIGLHAGVLELQHRVPEAPKDRPFYILTAPAFSPPLTAFMAQGREREGKGILWIGKGGSGNLEKGLRQVIAANGVLAFMADQHPGPAEECEYLHLWDRVRVPWPARLLRFLDANGFLCLPVSTRRDAEAVSRFTFHPPMVPTPGNVRAYLERAIAAAPEQWNWSYPKVMPVTPVTPVSPA